LTDIGAVEALIAKNKADKETKEKNSNKKKEAEKRSM